ncbi:hypothetical protein SARC_02117 [Sphaeroforma arctica JP610]|uniref:Ribosomal protein eL8/eL30/eS12/Gadd45 domain-containing protein n=1 Tax=Sphaeroforma arctica JP610 TaxID=667725 RepID=A0A0L0GA01_9EUKA|nr:hypothetical protein SARC_02117 [Sphaeroforma arctica JP610]KNC85706.1 hypothetical protein SARC_02117 [Sphaeroforma arctica JP610]|eukprot:XP_014159608.1 hypothetical protein SARC_02117 [Sphaeroforma arctica JP610]
MARDSAEVQNAQSTDKNAPKPGFAWSTTTRSHAMYNTQQPVDIVPALTNGLSGKSQSNPPLSKPVSKRRDTPNAKGREAQRIGSRTHGIDRTETRISGASIHGTRSHTKEGQRSGHVRSSTSAKKNNNDVASQRGKQLSSRALAASRKDAFCAKDETSGINRGAPKSIVGDKGPVTNPDSKASGRADGLWSSILKAPARNDDGIKCVKGVNGATQRSSDTGATARKPAAVPAWPSLTQGNSSGAPHTLKASGANKYIKQAQTKPKPAPRKAPKMGEGHAVSLFDLVHIRPARISSRAKISTHLGSQAPTNSRAHYKNPLLEAASDKKGRRTATANPLDSTASVRRRGKERLTAKKKRPTAMRKIIQADKEKQRKWRTAAVLSATLEALKQAEINKQLELDASYEVARQSVSPNLSEMNEQSESHDNSGVDAVASTDKETTGEGGCQLIDVLSNVSPSDTAYTGGDTGLDVGTDMGSDIKTVAGEKNAHDVIGSQEMGSHNNTGGVTECVVETTVGIGVGDLERDSDIAHREAGTFTLTPQKSPLPPTDSRTSTIEQGNNRGPSHAERAAIADIPPESSIIKSGRIDTDSTAPAAKPVVAGNNTPHPTGTTHTPPDGKGNSTAYIQDREVQYATQYEEKDIAGDVIATEGQHHTAPKLTSEEPASVSDNEPRSNHNHSFAFSANAGEFVPRRPPTGHWGQDASQSMSTALLDKPQPKSAPLIHTQMPIMRKAPLIQTPEPSTRPLLGYRSILSGANPVQTPQVSTVPRESALSQPKEPQPRTPSSSQQAKRKKKQNTKSSKHVPRTDSAVDHDVSGLAQPVDQSSQSQELAHTTFLSRTSAEATIKQELQPVATAKIPSKKGNSLGIDTSKQATSSPHTPQDVRVHTMPGEGEFAPITTEGITNTHTNKSKTNKGKGKARAKTGTEGPAKHFHLSQSQLIAARVADHDFFHRTVTLENTCKYNAIGSTHSAKFRGYCRNRVTKELLASTEQLTREISLMHHKKLKVDEAKANYRKRYAKGIREVQKALKTGVVRCVILPTDVENVRIDNGLNDQLRTLIDSCATKGIEVVYAMTRKSLGDCLIPKAPVSVVSIHDYSGTHVAYKALHKELEEQQRAYAHLINVHAKTCDTKCEARAKLQRAQRVQVSGEIRVVVVQEENIIIQPRQKHVYELCVTEAQLKAGQSHKAFKGDQGKGEVAAGCESRSDSHDDVETATSSEESGNSNKTLRISCAFSTDNGDIRFGVSRQTRATSGDGADGAEVTTGSVSGADVCVVEAKRVASDTSQCTFDWALEESGVFVLEWDNGYSRSKSKVLHFTIEKLWSSS